MNKVYSKIESIVGSVITVKADNVAYGELAEIETRFGLWLLSEEQVFGSDLPFNEQLELMKDPKHRVCSYPDGSRAYWWLRDVAYSSTAKAFPILTLEQYRRP